MVMKNYLIIVLIISIMGVLFSGYMSFKEIFKGSCSIEGSCGVSKIAGIPVCIYGLIMYLIIFAIALIGILKG